MNATNQNNVGAGRVDVAQWLDVVRRQVDSLSFGVVQIVVHDSRVVQIERTEKIRLETPLREPSEESTFARQTSGGKKL